MITLAIPTLRKFDLCVECVRSAQQGTRRYDRLIVLDDSGGELLRRYPGFIADEIIVPPVRLGVAGAWNTLMEHIGEDEMPLIVNDDITFAPDSIEKFAAVYNPTRFFHADQQGTAMFSCFVLSKYLWRTVGPFDQTFFPAYFEDNDYGWRMHLLGIESVYVPTTIGHVGSATLKTYTAAEKVAHHDQYRANERYYEDKWGGKPHYERYTTPFNL